MTRQLTAEVDAALQLTDAGHENLPAQRVLAAEVRALREELAQLRGADAEVQHLRELLLAARGEP